MPCNRSERLSLGGKTGPLQTRTVLPPQTTCEPVQPNVKRRLEVHRPSARLKKKKLHHMRACPACTRVRAPLQPTGYHLQLWVHPSSGRHRHAVDGLQSDLSTRQEPRLDPVPIECCLNGDAGNPHGSTRTSVHLEEASTGDESRCLWRVEVSVAAPAVHDEPHSPVLSTMKKSYNEEELHSFSPTEAILEDASW